MKGSRGLFASCSSFFGNPSILPVGYFVPLSFPQLPLSLPLFACFSMVHFLCRTRRQ